MPGKHWGSRQGADRDRDGEHCARIAFRISRRKESWWANDLSYCDLRTLYGRESRLRARDYGKRANFLAGCCGYRPWIENSGETMRVLTVVHSLGIGGVEVTLLRSLPYLRRLGVEIGVACAGEPGALSDSFVAEGATIHRLPRGANRMLGALPIREIVERFEYHLVHSMLGYNAGSHVIGAQLAGRPCLVSFHSSRPTLQALGISRRSLKAAALRPWLAINSHIILKHARLVIGHSEANLDQFYPDWRRRPDLFRVLTNGIEFPRIEGTKTDNRTFLGLPADVPVFLHVGNFRPQKNHSELLQIFREIRKHEPRSILVLVGDGPRRVVIEAEASRMGLGACCSNAPGRQPGAVS